MTKIHEAEFQKFYCKDPNYREYKIIYSTLARFLCSHIPDWKIYDHHKRIEEFLDSVCDSHYTMMTMNVNHIDRLGSCYQYVVFNSLEDYNAIRLMCNV